MEVIIIILICFIVWNIVWNIPNKLNEQNEKMSIHFKELQLRMNRLEKILQDKESIDK